MCRVCLLNRASLDWLLLEADDDYVTPWLEQLVVSNGGDGNGASVMFKYGRKETVKGLTLQPAQITEWFLDAYLAGAQYFLFHTRRASVGAVSTENCHPFKVGHAVLAHNGHDEDMIEAAKVLGYTQEGMTDSHAGAFLVAKKGPLALKPYSGTFVGFHRREPFVTLGKGHWPLHKIEVKHGGVIYASERPHHIKSSVYKDTDMRPYVHTTTTYAAWESKVSRWQWDETTRHWIDTRPTPGPKYTRNLTLRELGMSQEEIEEYYLEQRLANGWRS